MNRAHRLRFIFRAWFSTQLDIRRKICVRFHFYRQLRLKMLSDIPCLPHFSRNMGLKGSPPTIIFWGSKYDRDGLRTGLTVWIILSISASVRKTLTYAGLSKWNAELSPPPSLTTQISPLRIRIDDYLPIVLWLPRILAVKIRRKGVLRHFGLCPSGIEWSHRRSWLSTALAVCHSGRPECPRWVRRSPGSKAGRHRTERPKI